MSVGASAQGRSFGPNLFVRVDLSTIGVRSDRVSADVSQTRRMAVLSLDAKTKFMAACANSAVGLRRTTRAPEGQASIGLRVCRLRTLAPGIEAARRDIERPTQLADREHGLLRGDPGKSYCWCFAKKAAAFFRIYRSVRNSRFSFRS